MTNRIIIRIVGGHEDNELVRLNDMIAELSAIQGALSGVDRLISGRKRASTYYRIVKIETGSAPRMEIEGKPIDADYDITDEAGVKFLQGLDDIHNDREPEDFDYGLLEAFGEIGKTVGKTSSELSISRNGFDVLLKDELAPHVKKIVGEDMVYYGDVSGILEQVNIHGKKRDFYLYPVSGAPRIKCRFTKEDLEIGINSVNRYLKVTGRVKYHQKSSHPYEIDVDLGKVVVFPPEKELPTLFDLRGIAPDATGDLTTEEFISRLRGDG